MLQALENVIIVLQVPSKMGLIVCLVLQDALPAHHLLFVLLAPQDILWLAQIAFYVLPFVLVATVIIAAQDVMLVIS